MFLYGQSGVGKTWFCKNVDHKVYIDCSELASISNVEGVKIGSEYLQMHFERAKKSNATLILDNFSAICPKDDDPKTLMNTIKTEIFSK